MLGVYIASYNQPVFLRHCLLQIANSIRVPDVLAIHENTNKVSYKYIVEDVLMSLEHRKVDIVYKHTPYSMAMPTFFCDPLQDLIDKDCILYQKLDVDDIYYTDHLYAQQILAINNPTADYVLNANSSLLVLPDTGDVRHKYSVDFGQWNPIGGHPDNLIFRKNVAESFVKEMSIHTGMNDDVVFARYVQPNFKGLTLKERPTSCFVAHGKNVSVAHWSKNPPI